VGILELIHEVLIIEAFVGFGL